jgi:hypothetical protein
MTGQVPAQVTEKMAKQIMENLDQIDPDHKFNLSNLELGILRFLVENHLKIVER